MPNLATTEKAQATTLESYEIGYKGLIADKLSVTTDIYTIKREGFVSLVAVSPAIALVGADIGNDLGNAVTTGLINFLQTNTQLPAPVINQLAGQIGGGFNQGGQAVAAQLAQLYPIFGAVETNLVPQNDGIVHVPAGFVSDPDASIDFWGMDIGLEYYINNEWSVFGNYSYQNQTQWTPGEADDDGLEFPFSLNTPKNKFRLGVNFIGDNGWRGNVSFQHDDAFFGDLGLFRGMTPAKNLVDVGIGHKFDNGFSVDVSATNLFNSKYRPFANFPKIGRRALVKLTYTFGEEG
jgi:outer membrane receptor for ferrienterochelin and colicins